MKLLLSFWFGCVCLQSASLAQAPTVLTATNQAFVFELAPTASMASQLAADTTAKLATPAQHAARGLTYPLWLSDAHISVKTRIGQRQSVVVEAKRGNHELSTDLLIVFNIKGVRTLEPSTLIFDKQSSFVGAPMPAALQHDVASGFVSALKTKAPLDFSAPAITTPQAPVASTYAVPPPAAENHANVSLPPIRSETNRTQANVKSQQITRSEAKVVRAPEPSTSKITTASQATPVEASQAAAPATQAPYGLQPAPPVLPAAPALPTRPAPPPQKPIQAETSWLADWPLLAGAVTALALLLYLAVRMWRARSKRPDFAATLSPTEQAASTVFGLSDEEAADMHKRWLSQQILQKNNK